MIRYFIYLLILFAQISFGQEAVQDIQVRGNGKVEPDAIIAILSTKRGDILEAQKIRADIKSLYDLGYFSDIRIYKKKSDKGIILVVQVAEKPSIVEIKFEGMNELKEDDLKAKLETKIFTILNEGKLTADLRIIEKQYAEKGYYLARATYKVEPTEENEIRLKYIVEEGGKVQVADVKILGNTFFTEGDIINKLQGRPYTRSSAFGSSSIYQDDFVKNDLSLIGYLYRDSGFAEVKVAKPHLLLDEDKEFVRATYKVEEGIQYDIGTIDVSGDVLFPKEELFEAMKLKPGKLYRISFINKDIEMLVDKYGDLGYAYADINPIVTYDREKKLLSINYEVNKGDKVYFGEMQILGNTKTRDNVLRREFEVADSELYSGTKLTNSKKNATRLGFFEDIQVLKERDNDDSTLLNLKTKVKEKPTGQLQAAVGYTPQQKNNSSGFFGQGKYDEQNQSGRGYKNSLTLRWSDNKTYSLDLSFTNPHIDDSDWLGGGSLIYNSTLEEPITEVKVENKTFGGSVFLGRKIIEKISGRTIYEWTKTTQRSEQYLLDRYQSEGISSSLIFSLDRTELDNNISPTEGSEVVLKQRFTGGGILKGDYEYMRSSIDAAYYIPLDYTDTFRTNFKFNLNVAYIYPLRDKPVPFYQRFRLGGPDDLRGFDFRSISPEFNVIYAPGDSPTTVRKGGDKKLVMQAEYYIPLIQEAGIKFLLFTDWGQVYDNLEMINWKKGFKKDVGFGFRWITPIAPFRFEFAYEVLEGGGLGEMKPIFSLGY